MQSPIETRLRKALLLDGSMSLALYKHEVAEHVAYWKKGMRRDKDEFLFVVDEHSGDVAMLLITARGELFINEQGREKLRTIWHHEGVYAQNMELMIPQMAASLAAGELWVTGVKTTSQLPVGNPGSALLPDAGYF
ncbi:hypothetical protein QMK33_17795 [Hymenobacter sp. H14-R3]|uniref:hypothetical protein n=1 Tax=Hymenobacter sp. H14-R3 TaxID=3046308 RepID=UPI0024B8BDE1|nr:hypothetical protein [Hymenobacter sp. H14-R3]MDJ0367006.1 hypothetical protein [Hymenobacter sp. H14-R3]